MKVHQAVATTISDQGVGSLFGLMGDANMLYITDFMTTHQGRFVPVADERSSVLMAGGYAAPNDIVGVATVTHGPALTNTVTSLVEVARGRMPVVLITGDTPWERDYLQWIDIRAVAGLTGAGYERVWTPESTACDTARAFRRARAERRPIILDVPYDLLEHDAGDYRFEGPVRPQRTQADPNMLDDALGLMVSAARPVVLAGRGAVRAGAHDALVELADRLALPLATSLLAKDFFQGHPLNLGVCGTVSTPVASGRFAQADCVLAFGASLNQFTADRGGMLQNTRVIQVDQDPAAFETFTPVEVPIVGDARAVAEQMLQRLREAQHQPTERQNEPLARGLASQSPLDDFSDQSSAATIDLRTAMITLDGLLPERRNLVTDAGRFMTAPWRYIHVDDPRGFVHSVNFGSIGLGLGTAIGMAAARPDRVTVAVLGDGGFMQGSAELRVAVNERLPLIVVIANDGAYGAEWRKLKGYGIDPVFSQTNWPDLAGLAEAYGAHGHTVHSVEDLEKLKPTFAEPGGPVLIDVRIDPAVEITE
jgi:thiamine pyrophosphate-dependent acetolactate synthase large subunit-like protein